MTCVTGTHRPPRYPRPMPETTAPTAPRRARAPRKTSAPATAPAAPVAPSATPELDTAYLETLLGYNARRAALTVISIFLPRMAPYGLRPVDFSVLSLIGHNPGVTSRQLCAALDILPPNLVGMIKSLDKRGLIERRPHPTDRRAQGLHLSAAGKKLQRAAQTTATRLEREATHALSDDEVKTLISLLRRVYLR
ncbi:MarR family transcriptional regulator [Hydrogenophaga taeniospiralis CCUG 15921]|uniref:MarR family transcriptional regulator n=2 Tax=Hydrogenophaga TaxID=47420 RepID=A0A9X4NVW3_9BURK|nr:MarR family transcriptional regulator [Hydrogenophaga taeniospiralis CCUG 15921]